MLISSRGMPCPAPASFGVAPWLCRRRSHVASAPGCSCRPDVPACTRGHANPPPGGAAGVHVRARGRRGARAVVLPRGSACDGRWHRIGLAAAASGRQDARRATAWPACTLRCPPPRPAAGHVPCTPQARPRPTFNSMARNKTTRWGLVRTSALACGLPWVLGGRACILGFFLVASDTPGRSSHPARLGCGPRGSSPPFLASHPPAGHQVRTRGGRMSHQGAAPCALWIGALRSLDFF